MKWESSGESCNKHGTGELSMMYCLAGSMVTDIRSPILNRIRVSVQVI